jgi:hypothetical protein
VLSGSNQWGAAVRWTDANTTVGTTRNDQENITFLNRAGTVRTITNGQAQAEVLDRYCASMAGAKCTFTPTSKTEISTNRHQAGTGYGNNTSNPITKKLIVAEKVTLSQNVEVGGSAKANILGVVETAINTKYGRTWVKDHTFTDETNLTLSPHMFYWPVSSDPLTRYTGTFTITMGNTTLNLPDVHFDTPNPDGHFNVVWEERPLTQSEAASLPNVLTTNPVTSSAFGG